MKNKDQHEVKVKAKDYKQEIDNEDGKHEDEINVKIDEEGIEKAEE